jgi:hypothetical protein
MLILLIVLAVVVVLALLIGLGGFGGYGGGYGGGPGGPTVYRRIIYRRPARRVVTEQHIVEDPAVGPVDPPVYRP